MAKDDFDFYFSEENNENVGVTEELFVLTVNGKVAGVIGYYVARVHYWVHWFYVHNEYLKHGYGRRLLKYTIGEVRKKGVDRLYVYTASDEFYKPALRLYQSEGFRITKRVKNCFGSGSGSGSDKIILYKNFYKEANG
ncbi:MAG: GNAT family N-acetyltransferase [Nitrospinae bacterium]|nr:GNAT family N-acetyltransferase [Nitrospinota bacterium]